MFLILVSLIDGIADDVDLGTAVGDDDIGRLTRNRKGRDRIKDCTGDAEVELVCMALLPVCASCISRYHDYGVALPIRSRCPG